MEQNTQNETTSGRGANLNPVGSAIMEELHELRRSVFDLKVLAVSAIDRLSAVERLADGCKDAVVKVADHVRYVDGVSSHIFGDVCKLIVDAQRPPASAEGAEVVKGGGQ